MRCRLPFVLMLIAFVLVVAGCSRGRLTDEQRFWITNAIRDHHFTPGETALALGMDAGDVEAILESEPLPASAAPPVQVTKVLPYPGGRHPWAGLQFDALNPRRDTKASIFMPWDDHAYAVIDLPQRLYSNLGLLWLAHQHEPTIWDQQEITLPPLDWTRNLDGSLQYQRTLPNGVSFGARIAPNPTGADLEMRLYNGTSQTLSGLATRVCLALKGVPDFRYLTNANKFFDAPVGGVKNADGNRAILVAWQGATDATQLWAEELIPCLHVDPMFPECSPGQTVAVKGRIVLYQGADLPAMVRALKAQMGAATD